MKCPDCGFVSSDQRDVCVKCHLDLRPAKRQLGLAVTNSSASHQELLAQFGIQLKAPPQNSSKFFDFLKFSTNKESQHLSGEATTPKATAAAPSSGIVMTPQPLKASLSTSTANATPTLTNPALIDSDYFDCLKEVSLSENQADFSIQVEQFFDQHKSKTYHLLYNLAHEVLQNPEIEKSLVDKFNLSEERKVESVGLTHMLTRIEKRITAPVFGLKSLMAEARQRRHQAEIAETTLAKEPAGLIEKFLSWLLDLGTAASLAALSASIIFGLIDNRSYISLFRSGSLADLSLACGLALALFFLLLIFYPLLSLSMFKATVGTWVMDLVILNQKQRKIRLPHIIVRSFTGPLNILFLGFLPSLLKRRSLVDIASRSDIYRLPQLEQPSKPVA